jgi:hypothetical protein
MVVVDGRWVSKVGPSVAAGNAIIIKVSFPFAHPASALKADAPFFSSSRARRARWEYVDFPSGRRTLPSPSNDQFRQALFLASLTAEAGFPPGIIQVVSGLGTTGKALAEHMDIRKISCQSFNVAHLCDHAVILTLYGHLVTGSTRTGRFSKFLDASVLASVGAKLSLSLQSPRLPLCPT